VGPYQKPFVEGWGYWYSREWVQTKNPSREGKGVVILSGTTQDSALEVPGCHRLLTYAFGQLGKLSTFCNIVSKLECWTPSISWLVVPLASLQFFLDHSPSTQLIFRTRKL